MHQLDEKKSYIFSVNAFEVEAQYFKMDIQNIFLPLLYELGTLKKRIEGRIVVFIAAPPGVGKTTLSLFLEYLSNNTESTQEVQSVGIDGFHYPQEYLVKNKIVIDGEDIIMKEVKGSPETFDFERLKRKIIALKERNLEVKWPIYDRSKHDIVPDQILIDHNIILLEGNWLLLNEENWKDLVNLCDYSVFISAKESMLRERLIHRKIRGGLSKQDAERFYEKSDRKNVMRVLENRIEPDLMLELMENGKYEIRR